MNQVIKTAALFLSVGLLVILIFGFHVSALPMSVDHGAASSNHSSDVSVGCATACTSVNLQKKDYLSEHEDVQDYAPEVPYYAQLQSDTLLALANQHDRETRSIIDREPSPGGPPAYIALSVFRT